MLHISQHFPKSFRLKMLIMLHIPKVLRRMVMLGLQAESARKDIQHISNFAAEQGKVFGLSVLYRVYNFMRVCPKQGMNAS